MFKQFVCKAALLQYFFCHLWGIRVTLPGYGFSSCKSSATRSYHCVQPFHANNYMAASVWDF